MRREVTVRYQVLRNNAFYAWVKADPDDPPAIRADDSAAIKSSLSGGFFPWLYDSDGVRLPEGSDNWLADEIAPLLIVNGVEYPLGVYAPSDVSPEYRDGRHTLRVNALDRCWRVRDTAAAELIYFAAGTSYIDAVSRLLSAAGIRSVHKTPSDAVLAEDREDWDIGASYLDIVNDLLSEINYKPLFFGLDGSAILEPVESLSVPTPEPMLFVPDGSSGLQTAEGTTFIVRGEYGSTQPVGIIADHVISALDVQSLVRPGYRRSTDLYAAANVYIVTCTNPDKGAPLVASARNENPQSPLSVPRRGREIVSVEHVSNIASQEELQAYADKLRNESLIRGETIEVTTGLLPGFEPGDVTALTYGDINALCRERAYTMELTPGGRMTHTLERMVYAIGS